MATYGSFALSSAAFGRPLTSGADVCLVYATQLSAALPAMTAAVAQRLPYVLLIQDLWPDSIFATGFLTSPMVSRTVRSMLNVFARAAYNGAAHIAVISPGMRDRLLERGVSPEKISIVYNWTDESIVRPLAPSGVLRDQLGLGEGDFLMLYAGNHGYAQSLEAWLSAMELLKHRESVHLAMMGSGPLKENLRQFAVQRNLSNVHFVDPVPRPEIAVQAADADVLVISLKDDPLFRITLPGKTQACLALGKPIIASGAGDLAKVINDSGAGWAVSPEDVPAIVTAIESASTIRRSELSRMGENGAAYYAKYMSSYVGSEALISILQRVAYEGNR